MKCSVFGIKIVSFTFLLYTSHLIGLWGAPEETLSMWKITQSYYNEFIKEFKNEFQIKKK